jgi:hypothetical protein
MLQLKRYFRFNLKLLFLIKNSENWLTKTALAVRRANFFEMVFSFVLLKDQVKIYKIEFLTNRALEEKQCQIGQKVI